MCHPLLCCRVSITGATYRPCVWRGARGLLAVLKHYIHGLLELTQGLPGCPEKKGWIVDNMLASGIGFDHHYHATNHQLPRTKLGHPCRCKGSDRRRKNKKAPADKLPAESIHDIPDDLRLILLVLSSPLWIIRAASTCKRWRGIIAGEDGTFLRLARSLHPPAIVGHYLERWNSEHPSIYCHGGLVLLRNGCFSRPEGLVVCDPLTRRCQVICLPKEHWEETDDLFYFVYLLDGEDGGISISNFRLFGRFCQGSRRACIFSTADAGGWRFLRSSEDDLDYDCMAHLAGRANGSLYLGTNCGSVIIVDNTSLELSLVDLPTTHPSRHVPWKQLKLWRRRFRVTSKVTHHPRVP
ncbi:hypothetical protein PR202_gb24280 [Eleusine coracana subsp. coracana]|uniref:F-box domain-containing protein n=1 Tax=Eleusine coracana subsp. coracana TaxID=191504 RepID=A0AAV5FL38_ELECO|nr:hypothetical protein PR202_gb24280 [Eleusine coracana subsp. coracana]